MRKRVQNSIFQFVQFAASCLAHFFRPTQLGRHDHGQIVWIEGFDKIVVGSQLFSQTDVFFLSLCRKENERNCHPLRTFAYLFVEVVAVHERHHDVGQNEVNMASL